MTIVTKADIFTKINEYNAANERKCPSKDLLKLLGLKTVTERKQFEALVKNMKASGELLSKKGRGGGLYISPSVVIEVSDSVDESIDSEIETDTSPVIEATPVDIEDSSDLETDSSQDRSDESYQKLMQMSSGEIPMDEDWVKTNWPEAWTDNSEDEMTA